MKHFISIRALCLTLLAAGSAAAQEEQRSPEALARMANTVVETLPFHMDQPLLPGWTLGPDDIVLPPEGYTATYTTQLWSGGVVPYLFDSNMSLSDRIATVDAMQAWEAVANVDFREWAGDLYWVLIRNSDEDDKPACNSAVGMTGLGGLPGPQIINLTTSCVANGTFKVHHELGHCLGFHHEQSRPDRDDYITVNWGNIQGGPLCIPGSEDTKACNFEIEELAGKYGPYDFDSVMHYGQYSFSIDYGVLTTIDVKPPYDVAWQNAIGQSTHLSTWDKTVMSFLYPETNWRFDNPDWILPFSAGTFFFPWNKTFPDAVTSTPTGGTLFFIAGATFDWSGAITKAITIEAPLGGLVVN